MILVDAHVHLHPEVPIGKFFDAACENFSAAAAGEENRDGFFAVLMLAEGNVNSGNLSSAPLFDDAAISGPSRFWKFKKLDENESFLAERNDGHRLWVIRGQQIVTAEDLEVLALATDTVFRDGDSIRDVIENVRTAGAIPVVPWGVGKWTGKRGKIIGDLISDYRDREFFLGDNSGRPRFWRRPKHFEQSAQKGIPILPGSDPLPVVGGYLKVGSFGLSVSGTLDEKCPAASLRSLLMDVKVILKPFGRLEDFRHFVVNQFKMQLRKRLYKNFL